MIAYHEVNPSSLMSVLEVGLKRTSRGDLGDDALITKTDQFLDSHRSSSLKHDGVCRDDNLYAYVGSDVTICDITSGKYVDIADFIKKSSMSVLRLEVDPEHAFVSDLDRYDALKKAIEHKEPIDRLESLARDYWQALRLLAHYKVASIKRPEIMITYDISPRELMVLEA